MPRPIWNGAISFGLVTIPIHLEPATESHDIGFRQIHTSDGGRIRYRKICEIDGQELSQDEIGKGYELSKDHVIPITDEDLAGMPLPTAKAIEIVSFVQREDIDPIRLGAGSYYVAANGAVAAKPYTLLRQALQRTDKVAVAKYALRGRERLGLLRVVGNVMVVETMHWDDEIRDWAELAPSAADLSEDEIKGALALIDTMTVEHIDDLELTDQYREALAEAIEAKAEHREPQPVGEVAEPTGQVVDLMAALEQSVQKAREGRSSEGEAATVHEMPAPKKSAAKKTAAKKTAVAATPTAKKAAAKKTASSRGRKSA